MATKTIAQTVLATAVIIFVASLTTTVSPQKSASSDSMYCISNEYKMAFIYAINGNDTQPFDTSGIDVIREEFSRSFYKATDGLAKMNTSYPVAVIRLNDSSHVNGIYTDAANKFYERHPDIFDFLTIYTSFPTDMFVISSHANAKNDITGTGMPTFNSTHIWGSAGRLKGVNNMGVSHSEIEPPDQQSDQRSRALWLSSQMHLLLHETLHQWAAAAKYKEGNRTIDDLNDLSHWNHTVNISSQVGGSTYEIYPNGTAFKTELVAREYDFNLTYSALDLYLMGLKKPSEMPSIEKLYISEEDMVRMHINKTPVPAKVKRITIDQIIAANGPIGCIPKELDWLTECAEPFWPPGQNYSGPYEVTFENYSRQNKRLAGNFTFSIKGSTETVQLVDDGSVKNIADGTQVQMTWACRDENKLRAIVWVGNHGRLALTPRN